MCCDIFLLKLYLQNKEQISSIQNSSNSDINNSIDSISKIYTSKVYQFENFCEPKNATEGMIIKLIFLIKITNIKLIIIYLNKIEEQEGINLVYLIFSLIYLINLELTEIIS